MTWNSESEQELRVRIARGSAAAPEYLKLASVLRDAARFDEAADVYEDASRLEFSNLDKARILWEFGALLDRVMSRSSDAATLAQRALDLVVCEPDSPEKTLLLGISYALLAQAGWARDETHARLAAREAVSALEDLIARHSDHPDLWMALSEAAWAHTSLANYERAIDLSRRNLAIENRAAYRLPVLMTLAEAARSAGRLREAEAAIDEGLQVSSVAPIVGASPASVSAFVVITSNMGGVPFPRLPPGLWG